MTTITTRKEQHDTAAAARKAGGYSELIRLAGNASKQGGQRDSGDGNWSIKLKPKG